MLKIAIVESDAHDSATLSDTIAECCKYLNVESEVSVFDSGMDFVSDYPQPPIYGFDVIFFAIDLPFINGIDAAKRIRQITDDVVIVFVTSHAEYALRGYEVAAADFIVKPIEYESFSESFRRIVEQAQYIQRIRERRIVITYDSTLYSIRLDDVYYIEAFDHMLMYHLRDKTYVARGTVDEVESAFRRFGFFRIYKSFLVNMNFVEKVDISRGIVVVGGAELPVSRFRKKEFLSAFTGRFCGNT